MVKRDLVKQFGLFVILVLGVIGLRVWFFEPVTIQQDMANDYLKQGEIIVAVKNGDVSYGDFVLYQVGDKEYVGRIIAVAGDKVTYMDDVLYRNDQIVAETYLPGNHQLEYYTEDLTISSLTNGEAEAVPSDGYLILNDVRTNHKDSREFGIIDKEQIIGRLTFRISPLGEFGFIENGLAKQG